MDAPSQHEIEKAYDAYADSIFRYLLVKSRDRQVALDLTQEAFVKTWEYMTQKDTPIKNIRPFLYRVAHNLWCSFVRDDSRRTSLDTLIEQGWQHASDEDIEKDARTREDHQAILKKLEELNDDYRDILILRYIENMSIGEIAEILQKNENAISVTIHRAKKKLESLLEQEDYA